MLSIKTLYYILFAVLLTSIFFSCGEGKKNTSVVDDPTDVYSIIKEDTLSGIDIVSVSGCNPIEVRKRILSMDIPEETYQEKRTVFYALLNQLYALRDTSGGNIAYLIDSLNYMAIHYLQDMLADDASLTSPLRHRMLKAVSCFDKTMTVYSWKDNLGVKLQMMINVVQYRSQDSSLRSAFFSECTHGEDVDFACSHIISIHKLNTEGETTFYLFNFSGDNGGKKKLKGSAIVEIVEDNLDFDNQAFEGVKKCYIVKYAEGEDVVVTFAAKTQTLQYVFKNSEWTHKTVFKFDGRTFKKQYSPE